MEGSLDPAFVLACAGAIVALGVLAYLLARHPVPAVPRLGVRGLRRSEALAHHGLFRALDPVIRVLSGWLSVLPLTGLRRKAAQSLVASGHVLGLGADEILAVAVLTGLGALGGGVYLVRTDELSPLVIPLGFAIGLWAPLQLVTDYARSRLETVFRELAAMLDLVALCMTAGLDLGTALRRLSRPSQPNEESQSIRIQPGPLEEEIRLVLQDLDLGAPRREALAGLAERVPHDSVQQFVSTVVRAEEAGTPLAEALLIQSTVLRNQRSVAAEEAAERASRGLVVPLTLMGLSVSMFIMGAVMLGMRSGSLFR
jgi:tight adherence protein C